MSVLVIIDQAPYGSWRGRESLDMALSLAAFDQPASLLFTGPGVNWLRAGQEPAGLSQKAVERNVSAAPIFGIEELLVDRQSLAKYQLEPSALIAGTSTVDYTPELLANYYHVVCL
ncbi:DsrE family protein [Marinobacter mobilis]|uniref:tRNA 2-thiouridine synthesizing protein C n=1 Tax=Marinobacter mobilis TaxID=488533 RepID=A0A1H2V7C8_9GAMM|nr:DsrE family protein [Marinobacter mobilis]SDW64246.1 tRNA 2-thiouridine synthesizing protein C [Marinobacter mobilis]